MELATQRHEIELVAGTVHYREAGPGEGRPVVFVHGFLVDDTVWSDVPERLAELGFHVFAPTWPLGSHRTAMHAGAELTPNGIARIVLDFLQARDLRDVVLVGSDTGGAVCQLLLVENPSRIGGLVLTNCDAFETFPPFPFNLLFRLCRHPDLGRSALQATRSTYLRNSRLGFGWLVRRDLAAEESRAWVTPYLTHAGVRLDLASFCRGWRRDGLVDASAALARFERPVLLCWAPGDPFFRAGLATRLAETAPLATLVEFDSGRTFVSLDRPERLAAEIAAWAAAP